MLYYKRWLKFCLPHIPLEIQLEIIKRISNVKSLMRFGSVSKQWMSFIDSSDFIASYGARDTHPRRFLLFYNQVRECYDQKYTCFVDEDNNTLTQHQGLAPIVVQQLYPQKVIGSSRGLLCVRSTQNEDKIVLCNPSIRKSVRIFTHPYARYSSGINREFGFGVCPVTNDPTIVYISYPGPLMNNRNKDKILWNVDIFTLRSGVWNVLPSSNMPTDRTIRLNSLQVVIDRFIYWVAYKLVDGRQDDMIISFDLISKEFRAVDIPDSLKFGYLLFSISKLMESLILFVSDKGKCDVLKMEC